MKNALVLTASLFILVFLSFTACNEMGDSSGQLSILITDAPFPIDSIEEATVTITKVELRKDAETENDETENDETEEYPFITVFEGSETFNLLDLRNGVMQQLAEVEVPTGSYNLIRVYVEEAGIVVKEHGSFSMKVPSGSQTGIKMFVHPSLKVSGELTAEVLLDFNLDQSFVLKGNMESPAGIKGFNFKPVIRAVNNTTAGTIAGVVSDADEVPIEGAAVTLLLDGVETTAQTGEDGFYAFPGIPAGTYALSVEKEGYSTLSVEDVVVVEGNKTIQNFVLEPETTDTPEE